MSSQPTKGSRTSENLASSKTDENIEKRFVFARQGNIYYIKNMLFNKLYFYTSTIYQWKPLIRGFQFESIILDSLSYLHSKGCLNVYGFVIMPNHIHIIWELLKMNGKETPSASLMKFTAHRFEQELSIRSLETLQAFKVNNASRKYNFWQTNPDWFLLNYIPTIEQKLNYIHYNPLQPRRSLCERSVDYRYSSANFYTTGKNEFDFLHHYNEFVEGPYWDME